MLNKTMAFPQDDFEPSEECEKLLGQQSQEAGPHNIYNIYDNCPRGGCRPAQPLTHVSIARCRFTKTDFRQVEIRKAAFD